MEVGVFIPIGNNGWLLSENAPQYRPSFDLNKEVVLRAEKYGFDFALSMIKLRGFGGKTEFWDHNLESFTLMAGLAAVTTKIRLFATAATLVMPPAIVARMASTIDSISHGRFGLNVITGWQRPEYSQMGMWPGDEYFTRRYDYLAEYVQVLRDLWGNGQSDFKGDFFKMDDCRVSPRPGAEMKLICAGQSDAGLAFTARYADYNFGFGKGVNTPAAFSSLNTRLAAATAKAGRHVESYLLFMIIADETDAAARARWEYIKAGADQEAIAWLGQQSAADKSSGADTNVRQMADPTSAVNINMGTLVGSYESVARMLDEVAAVPGTGGVLLTFDDFVNGVTTFGKRIQPLMTSRKAVPVARGSVMTSKISSAIINESIDRVSSPVVLPARPEPLRINAAETAVIVVDMQNAYATKGGYVDIAGFDISGAAGAIGQSRKVLEAARAAGCTVIFFQNGWDKDCVEAGGPGSPNWHKSNAMKTMRARPELAGTLLAKGTWDYAIVDGLAPQPGDILIPKTRYSGFFNTNVDSVLRSRGIRTLVFIGVATNVCVESSLRDAFHLEYFSIVLEDAVHHLGPDFVRQASLYNIEKFFGWVSNVTDFCGAVLQSAPTHSKEN